MSVPAVLSPIYMLLLPRDPKEHCSPFWLYNIDNKNEWIFKLVKAPSAELVALFATAPRAETSILQGIT